MGTKNAVIETLCYSDLFDYPLKKQEIWNSLISSKKINRQDFEKGFKAKEIGSFKDYYFLKRRQKLVSLRIKKEKEGSEVLKKSTVFLRKLSIIPTVMLCGISGSLSMKNSAKDADIDLFVISSASTIWITRLLLIVFLSLNRKYRRRNDKNVSGKYCLNMIIDENNLSFQTDRQDLFTAHEVIQLLPIFSRNKTYEKFIKKNSWVKNFLPNAKPKYNYQDLKEGLILKIFKLILKFRISEYSARFLQKKYMGTVSNETITNNFLAFHPRDIRVETIKRFNKKASDFKY